MSFVLTILYLRIIANKRQCQIGHLKIVKNTFKTVKTVKTFKTFKTVKTVKA